MGKFFLGIGIGLLISGLVWAFWRLGQEECPEIERALSMDEWRELERISRR